MTMAREISQQELLEMYTSLGASVLIRKLLKVLDLEKMRLSFASTI